METAGGSKRLDPIQTVLTERISGLGRIGVPVAQMMILIANVVFLEFARKPSGSYFAAMDIT